MQVAIGILIGLVAGGLGGAFAVGALGKSRLGAAQQQRKQLIEEALESLEPEAKRARRLVESRGPGAKTARYLASKGFGEGALEAAAGADFAPDP